MKRNRYFNGYIAIAMLLCILFSATVSAQTLKFSVSLDSSGQQILPVMGDVTGDGTQDLVMCASSKLYVVNGKTGAKKQIASDCYYKALELADLNKDGKPEILYGASGTRIKALWGNGSVIWSRRVGGDSMGMFPILTTDQNKDGYPEIYFATEDTAPWPYSGNMGDYKGAVTKLDHKGNVKATAWIEHPCWGGLAYADGLIYVSDRRSGYGNFPANGLHALNATTLKMVWSRPEMMHSSNLAIVADYNGDGKNEVIATPLNKGAVVLNARTGAIIKDYSSRGLSSHGTATVYDIDGDGHAEILQAGCSPCPNVAKVTVTDLVTGEVKAELRPGYNVSWPPKLGDINNDGKLDILVGTGTQGYTSSYPLVIYDSSFNKVKSINVGRAGQLMPVLMYDTDSDGLFEMVVTGAAGKVLVYDTATRATQVDSWRQFYGNERAGVPN